MRSKNVMVEARLPQVAPAGGTVRAGYELVVQTQRVWEAAAVSTNPLLVRVRDAWAVSRG